MSTPVRTSRGSEATPLGSGETLVATMERSLETVRHVFGGSHRYYLEALEHYAKALSAIGDMERAAEAGLRAARIREEKEPSAESPLAKGKGSVPRVLDAQRAARYLSLGLDTLYRLVRSGEVPHTRIGKSIRFRPEDLDEYIASRVTREWSRVDRRGRPRQKPVTPPAVS